MIRYSLEPEIYSFRMLALFSEAMKNKNIPGDGYPVHLKLDTGMRRLGFEETDIPELVARLKNLKQIKIRSVFSHLAASDEPHHDEFTVLQVERFKSMSGQITSQFPYPVLLHMLNSAGALRFQEAQFDMVRLGIGLYGVAPTEHEQKLLQQVVTLKTTISQIKHAPAGETIGYSRKGKVSRSSVIATVAIGYADGLDRRLGNGAGKMIVNGKPAPIVGNVCMDMTMIDITGISAKEGDEAIVFGSGYTVTEFAKDMGTIPYEVLTNISQRVKRVYFHE
jgi:alanine racemase